MASVALPAADTAASGPGRPFLRCGASRPLCPPTPGHRRPGSTCAAGFGRGAPTATLPLVERVTATLVGGAAGHLVGATPGHVAPSRVLRGSGGRRPDAPPGRWRRWDGAAAGADLGPAAAGRFCSMAAAPLVDRGWPSQLPHSGPNSAGPARRLPVPRVTASRHRSHLGWAQLPGSRCSWSSGGLRLLRLRIPRPRSGPDAHLPQLQRREIGMEPACPLPHSAPWRRRRVELAAPSAPVAPTHPTAPTGRGDSAGRSSGASGDSTCLGHAVPGRLV